VTIVFADLAGFTERSDRADPEDVRRILVPFHAIAKEEIERFGGTLDKFIGDAAMGVFGAPMAHEDDPERAVRAALAIRDRVSGSDQPVRIAVHTGEALVTSGEGPLVGERVAGDVVNTASRLQSFAPEGSVIVGEPTERATRHAIDYRPMRATRVKGKADPLAAFVATALRPDTPEREEDDPPAFVGRVRERELLHDLLERTIGDRTPRLVTVVGEPGIGKTRLVLDLQDHLRATHEGVAWHRGRCRPFGESITFAAIDEVVRSIAGIGAGAQADEIRTRLDEHLAGLDLTAEDREWMGSRLRPLLGVTDDDAPVDVDETFTAWARYFETVVERTPRTIVVEDLHWADDPLLDFLERLMERAPDVPLFLVCTGRPELFARRPGWAAPVANATTISLSPLTDPEMSDLLAALLLRSVAPSADSEVLLRRAGGNPLYAREFVHMLQDRGDEGGATGASTASGAGVPDTVQALIAARLDALAPDERSLLQAASVVGDRFWRGVLAALEPDAIDLDDGLRVLQRRGLIRRSSTSTIEGEAEYAFAHALIRDVAYGRLPRPTRSHLHRDVGAWLETVTDGAGLVAQADLLASHATRALDLARAAGLDDEVLNLEATAMRTLVLAGDRQVSLDAARAAQSYREALALAPPGAERANVRRLATSLGWRSGGMTNDEAIAAYREAEREATEADDPRLSARVLRRMYYQFGLRGETAAAHEALERAIALVEDDPGATKILAELYACRSEAEMFAGRSDGSKRWAERALELPRTQTVTLMALHLRGNARCELGDLGGVEDLREALEIAEASGIAIDIVTSYSYLLEWVGLEEGPSVGLPMNRTAVDLCRRRGIEGQGMWTRAEGLWLRFDACLWDEVLGDTSDLLSWADAHGDAQITTVSQLYRARVLAHRLDGEALELAETFLPVARQIEDLQVLAPALLAGILAASASRDDERVRALTEEFDVATAEGPAVYRETYLPEIVRALLAAGSAALAERIVGDRPTLVRRPQLAVATSRAILAAARGDDDRAVNAFREVAEGWRSWGGRFEEAHALEALARLERTDAPEPGVLDRLGVRLHR
jgi:class 3 adenylate cyclase